jgi:PAS domain S-box-containing protein
VKRKENQPLVTSSSGRSAEPDGAEEALQRSASDLAAMKHALDQAAIVATTDRRGIITYVNDKFCEISKYSREELLGKDHRIINSGYHPKEFFRDMWRTIASGQNFHGEIRNRAKDGSIYWVDTTIVPFLDEKGLPYQYMAIRHDITHQKLMQTQLMEQASLTRLGEMAAVVAHEVKNPLAGLRGALEILKGRLPDDSADRDITQQMMDRIDALNQMVQELLVFARPRPPHLSPVPIVQLLQETSVNLKRDREFERVEVAVEGGELSLQADRELLIGMFMNLFLNAAQAMGKTGTIKVRVSADADSCHVVVCDSGPGIPGDVRDRIFEPFFTTKSRGTGLGLAIARRTVDLHGGTITVACPDSGGTAVTVSLPVRGHA